MERTKLAVWNKNEQMDSISKSSHYLTHLTALIIVRQVLQVDK